MGIVAFLVGCICGVIGFFLIKSGVEADPNELGKIIFGVILELICLILAGWALIEFSD
jgi:hypothetical protein